MSPEGGGRAPEIDPARARQFALQWLARREHSRQELQAKLIKKGCAEPVAAQALNDLEAENLLSDERFAESLLRARRDRGYGPLRILKDLREKGVAEDTITRWLDVASHDWIEDLKRVRFKKYGDHKPRSYSERAKQARFLQQRGFTFEQIRQVLSPYGDVPDPREQE